MRGLLSSHSVCAAERRSVIHSLLSARAFHSSAFALIILAMTACGGGSDGGTTPQSGCRVSAVSVTPDTVTLAVGETRDLFATYAGVNCTVDPATTWSTSNPSALSLQPDAGVAHVTGLAVVPQPITVSATISGLTSVSQVTVKSPPTIKLTPESLSFTATQNGTPPLPQTVALTNAGGGVLSQVGPGTTVFGPGASGWLFIQKSGLTSTAPYSLTIQPTNSAFPPGTYTATVPITSPVATNSPQNITVLYTITGSGSAPAIANLVATLVSVNSCGSGSSTGNTYRATFSFADPAGDGFTGSVLESYVFQPSGITGNVSTPVPSTQVSVSNGTITISNLCVIFATNSSMAFTVALQSTSGQTSNNLTTNIPKPAGGSTVGTSGD